MENYSMKTAIKGSVALYNKMKTALNIANKLSWFNPKKPLLYVLTLVYTIGYYITERIHWVIDAVLFAPINSWRRNWHRGTAKSGLTKVITK